MATCTKADSVLEAAALIRANGSKIDKFTNGSSIETVQLGSGPATPVLRNVVRQMLSAASEIDGTDASGKFVLADGATQTRTLADHFTDTVCAEDFGAVGDGDVDDSAAFAALEDAFTDIRINLHGKTFKVTTPPCGNYYYNGYWTFTVDYDGTAVEEQTKPAYNDNVVMEYGSVHAGGSGTTGRNYCILNDAATEDVWKTNLKNVVAIGENTLTKSIEEHSSYLSDYVAIGRGVMSEADMTANGGHNIGIGQFALHELSTGDRNIAIGSLAMLCSQRARKNVAIGRDAAQTMIGGSQNVVVGYQALAGMGYSAGSTHLEAQNEVSPISCCFIGSHSAPKVSGTPRRVTMLGAFSLLQAKSVSNSTVIGAYNANKVGYNKSVNQYEYMPCSISTTYIDVDASCSVSSSIATLAPADTSFLSDVSSGDALNVDIQGIDTKTFIVTVVTSTTVSIDIETNEIDGATDIGATIESHIKGNGIASFVASNSKAVLTPLDVSVTNSATIGRYVYVKIPGIGGNLLYVSDKTSTTVTVDLTGNKIDGTSGTAVIYGVETGVEVGYSNRTVNRTTIVGELQFNEATNIFGTTAVGSQIAGAAAQSGAFDKLDAFGYLCGSKLETAQSSTLVGAYSTSAASSSSDCVAVGTYSESGAIYSRNSVAIGYNSGVDSGCSYNNVFIGTESGHCLIGSSDASDLNQRCRRNTAVGYRAMYTTIDGGTSTTGVRDSTAIGAFATVSGSLQVQLGGTGTTTYAYGAVQDRSDARDKADVRDTVLGLDFLKELRPVDFKWDYRDSYIDIVDGEDGTATIVRHEKDGSRKRSRFHHGLIAQEVKAVLDEKGIDFGGYQDHKINGGADVLTLGYEEFIGPIIKAIQEINARLEALEG